MSTLGTDHQMIRPPSEYGGRSPVRKRRGKEDARFLLVPSKRKTSQKRAAFSFCSLGRNIDADRIPDRVFEMLL